MAPVKIIIIAYPTIEVQQPIAYIDAGQPTPFAQNTK